MRPLLRWLSRAELLWLALLAPLLFFPGDGRGLAIVALPLLWLLRKAAKGYLLPRTPVNAPLLLLLLMLGVAFTVSFDQDFSFPYLTRALLGIAIFFALVDVTEADRALFLSLMALVVTTSAFLVMGLINTQWAAKIPQLEPVVAQIPTVSLPFPGAADAFNPNIIAGMALYVGPLLLASLWPRHSPVLTLLDRRWRALPYVALLPVALLAVGLLILTQSRGGYLGFAVGLAALLLMRDRRWFGAALLAAIVAGAVLYGTNRTVLLAYFNEADMRAVSTGIDSLQGRMEIWSRAIYAMEDFPFTGVGLGLFRQVVPLLYPLFTISPDHDIGHAHNQFLAAAVDVGIPGLIAYLALWLSMAAMLWRSWHSALPTPYRRIALGLAASLAAHFTWSVTDALVIGARGQLPFWMLLASVVALHRTAVTHDAEAMRRGGPPGPNEGAAVPDLNVLVNRES